MRMVVITENRREREGEKESFIKGAPKGEKTRCMYVGGCYILDVLWREFYRLAVQLQTYSVPQKHCFRKLFNYQTVANQSTEGLLAVTL